MNRPKNKSVDTRYTVTRFDVADFGSSVVTGAMGDPLVPFAFRERAHFSSVESEIDFRRETSLDLVMPRSLEEAELPVPEVPPPAPGTTSPI
jgi:hypothetical protein